MPTVTVPKTEWRSARVAEVAEDGVATEPDNQRDGGRAEEFDDGIVERVGEDGVGPGLFVLGVDGRVVVEGTLLAVEELHDSHAGDVLLGEGVDAGGGVALAAIAVADVAAEDTGDIQNGWDNGDGQQGERPAHAQHDDDDEGQNEDILEDGEYARGEHFVERVDVGSYPGDEPADGVVIEEPGRHALQMAEDLTAQIEHDLLPGPLHGVGLKELQQISDEECAEVKKAELRDACHCNRAEMTGEPRGIGIRNISPGGRKEVIHRDLDEVRTHHIAAGLEDDGDGCQTGLDFVRAKIGEQPAHEVPVIDFADDVIVLDGFFCGLLLRALGFSFVCHAPV